MTEAHAALSMFFELHTRLAGVQAEVRVWRDPKQRRALAPRGHVREFLRLPSTGGAYVLASLGSPAAFAKGLEGLTLSRPIWLLARRVLQALAPLGLHRCLGFQRPGVQLPAGAAVPEREYALQMGVPGGGQKLVVREWIPGQEESYWKLGQGQLPSQLVRSEASALRWLAEHRFSEGLAPELLAAGEEDQLSWLKMKVLTGVRPPTALEHSALRFLEQLAGRAPRSLTLQDSDWRRQLGARLEAIQAGAPRIAGACAQALTALDAELRAEPLAFTPSHGDFTPWNAKLEGGRLRAFDWEFFSSAAPALFDWHHWQLQTGVLVEHLEHQVLFERLCASTPLAGEMPAARRRQHLTLYLIEVLVREEWIMQQGRPDFPQVQWLREARLELLARTSA